MHVSHPKLVLVSRNQSAQREMTEKTHKKALFHSMMLSSTFALCSCAASPGVSSAQRFGAMSAQFRDDTNKIANDIYDSCIRRVQFFRTDTVDLRKVRDEAWQDCDRLNKPAAGRAREANQIVVDYADAIGRLASDEVVSYDKELTNVGTALKGLSIPTGSGVPISLPPSAVDSGVKIASFLARWAANRYREGKLSEAVTCTNAPLQAYTKEWGLALNEGYIQGVLQQELDQAKFFYDDYTGKAKREGGTWRDFLGLSKESYNVVLPIIERRNAALSYIAVISRTAKAHEDLTKIFLDGSKPLTPESAACKSFLVLASSASDSLGPESQQLYSKELSPYKLMKAQKVLVSYRNDVSPLLDQMEKDLRGK